MESPSILSIFVLMKAEAMGTDAGRLSTGNIFVLEEMKEQSHRYIQQVPPDLMVGST